MKLRGEVGVGGVLYSPIGNRLLYFSWNLGKNSNNMAEAYAIYKGILLTQEHQLKHITIVSDLKNIVHYFVMGTNPKSTMLQKIIYRTKTLISSTQDNFFHILCRNNREFNKMANQAIRMAPGSLKVQGQVVFTTPP
jgi:ribonuclease HI